MAGRATRSTRCLRHTRILRPPALHQPNLSVRYHAGMSADFLDACVQVIRCGFGMPAFNNDEIVIPEFIAGVEPQDAYDYAAIGCIETAVGGKWGYRCTGMSFINFARVLLAALEQGRDATPGRFSCRRNRRCPKLRRFRAGDGGVGSANPLLRAQVNEIECVVDSVLEENAHDILCSALVDDCIERGKSIARRRQIRLGFRPAGRHQPGQQPRGGAKTGVRPGAIGQQQLATALAEDFAGLDGEQLRQRLLNAAPKYGNDVDEVDRLLVRATYIEELKQYRNTRFGRGPIGGGYYAGTSSISANVPFGAATFATPDGRKAGAPLGGRQPGVRHRPPGADGGASESAAPCSADDVAHLLRELSRLACAVQHRVARNAAGGEATP